MQANSRIISGPERHCRLCHGAQNPACQGRGQPGMCRAITRPESQLARDETDGRVFAAGRASGAETIHFVTHSLGGILLRYEHKRSPIEDLGRVVMLGPPNQGSGLIDRTVDWPGFDSLSGAAGRQLGTGEDSMPLQLGPVDFELGVIAGTGTINILASALLPDIDDGKVTVARTKVAGMDDFLIVGNSHRYITRSAVVVRNTESFLRTGRFLDENRLVAANVISETRPQ